MAPILTRLVGMRVATRAACLMTAATPRPKPNVTQDPARNGLISIEPAPDGGVAHSATFIGPMHGLGDTNMGWLDVAGHLHMEFLPHVKFVLPNAPTAPVTLNGGMQMPSWYDITSLDERAGQECEGIEASRSTVVSLIEQELAAGIPLSRIVVGGFSQGGALSLFTGLQYPGTLAGVCVMSGYLPKDEAFEVTEAAKATPVAHFHGIDDPVVKIEWARMSVERVRARGVSKYDLTEYPGLQHGVNPEAIADVAAWLKTVLPPLGEKDEL